MDTFKIKLKRNDGREYNGELSSLWPRINTEMDIRLDSIDVDFEFNPNSFILDTKGEFGKILIRYNNINVIMNGDSYHGNKYYLIQMPGFILSVNYYEKTDLAASLEKKFNDLMKRIM